MVATVRACVFVSVLGSDGDGDAPVELGRRVEQRLVGGGGCGGGGGEGRVGGPAERDGRAGQGQGGRRRGGRDAAAAGDQGAGQVRRRPPRGRRLLHCHLRSVLPRILFLSRLLICLPVLGLVITLPFSFHSFLSKENRA